MRDVEVSVKRGATTKIQVIHETLMDAVNLFISTYGTLGIEKIDDKGESSATEFFIQWDPTLEYQNG